MARISYDERIHPFKPRRMKRGHGSFTDRTPDGVIVCDYYRQYCLECNNHFGLPMVNRHEEDVELKCPKCGDTRVLCKQFAIRATYEVDDNDMIISGIPRCIFHGGVRGKVTSGHKRTAWLSSLLPEADEEIFEILINSEFDTMAEDMSSFLYTQLETVWRNNEFSDKEKIQTTMDINKNVAKLVKSFATLKKSDGSINADKVREFVAVQVPRIKLETYKEVLNTIVFPAISEVVDEETTKKIINLLPERCQNMLVLPIGQKDDVVEAEYEIVENEEKG